MVLAKAQAPKFDPSLPTTEAEIEAATEAVMREMAAEGAARVERHERGHDIHMTPSQTKERDPDPRWDLREQGRGPERGPSVGDDGAKRPLR